MSKYTVEVRTICEVSSGLKKSVGYNDIEETIQHSIPVIFDFKFPIFDESYRNVLATKILKHYYTREIAFETVGMWKLKLNTRLNEILPYYNQLYKSELLEFNPLYDVDITRTQDKAQSGNEKVNGTIVGKNDTTSNSNVIDTLTQNVTDNQTQIIDETKDQTANANVDSNNTQTTEQVTDNTKGQVNKFSDTPQGSVSDLENDDYLTNVRMLSDEANTTTNSSVNDVEETTSVTTTHDTNNVVVDNAKTSKTDNLKNTDVSGTINNTNNTTTNNNKDINTTEEFLESVKGKQSGKSYAELLKEYRSTFLNIDMMVIGELKDLFFTLW